MCMYLSIHVYRVHSEIPDEVLADDERCLEALVAMDVSV